METTEKVIGYKGLGKILGLSPKYLATLKSQQPDRLPPTIRTSKTKWHIDTVNEWLKDDKNNKPSHGRPRKKYNIL